MRERIIGSWGELDIWHHMIITIPAEIWGLITHILMYLRDCSWLVGWQKKRNHKPVLPTYLRLDISNFSAVHFLAFAFLVITFWSKECVITGIEGLMGSGSVTNVTGTLFRMRNTFCWTVHMNILLAFAHSTASWSSHLSMRIAHSFEDILKQPDICGAASFVAECLALFP